MPIVLCPGVHAPELTERFLQALQSATEENTIMTAIANALVFPVDQYPAYSAPHILSFLRPRAQPAEPLLLIAFSAGVVGAIATAWAWQQQGGQITAFIALDGWGVPLYGTFPIHRISHDHFTHWSSALLGDSGDSFYADPAVDHLDLWRSPQTVKGWRVSNRTPDERIPETATTFLTALLMCYLSEP